MVKISSHLKIVCPCQSPLINVKMTFFNLSPLSNHKPQILSRDSVTVSVDAVVYFNVIDAELALCSVDDFRLVLADTEHIFFWIWSNLARPFPNGLLCIPQFDEGIDKYFNLTKEIDA